MTMHPTSQPGQGNDKKARLTWRNSGPIWFGLFLTVAMLAFNGWFSKPHQAQRANLSYTAFLEQLRAGNVSQVEMAGEEIQGQLKQPVPWQPDSKSTPAQHDTFTTSLPPIDDTRLLPLLNSSTNVVGD